MPIYPRNSLTDGPLIGLAACLTVGLLAGLSGCAAPSPAPEGWAARVAEGQLQRAQEQAATGDHDKARQLAREALLAARQAACIPIMAQAQLLLGRLDADPTLLDEANSLFVLLDDDGGQAQARVALAELAVQSGQIDAALAHIAAATRELQDTSDSREDHARTEARVDHLHATALRLSGRRSQAAGQERQALLMLSLLRDDELLPLRVSVRQSLGDDCAATFDYAQAVEHHAQASDLARRSADVHGELAAAESLAVDLQGLGRPADAFSHCARALRLAASLRDRERTQALLHRSQEILLSLGEGPGSARWEDLAATAEAAGGAG